MFLRCIGSGSSGNSYALVDNDNKILLLDLGMTVREIKRAIDYRISDVVGAVVTHAHLDHSRSVKDFESMGIPLWKPYAEDNLTDSMKFGGFKIQCFPLPHNGTPNFGFYIKADNQKILYMTDFEYCKFNFQKLGIQHFLVECNYMKDLVDRDLPQYEHKIRGHCSLDYCKRFIEDNKTNALRTVLLLHMGADTCEPMECVEEVKKVAGTNVNVDYAEKGKEWELNEIPF